MLTSLIRRASALLLTLSTLAACSPTIDKGEELKAEPSNCEASGKSFGIVGGDVLASDNDLSSSTVMVIHLNKNEEVSICTGTLIDSNKVLSAAHCTTPHGKKTVIAFTNNVSCLAQAPKRTLRLVTQEAIHPDYSYDEITINKASSDLAVFKFKGDLPVGYKVRKLPEANFTVIPSDQIVLTGYGATTEGRTDSGTLRFTTAPTSHLVKEFYLALQKTTVSVPRTLTLEQSHRGVCTGDSGGPLYIHTGKELTLVGITSMGIDNRTTDKKNVRPCHGVALFTDVRAHLDWILEKKETL